MQRITLKPPLNLGPRPDPLRRLSWYAGDATPHHKRAGAVAEGWHTMDVTGHSVAGWVSLHTMEAWQLTKNGATKTHQTLITLDRESATALRDLLNDILG